MRLRGLALRLCALGLLLPACDRNDLQDGPSSSGGSVEEPPPPPTGDCPELPAAAALKVKINEIMTQNTATLEDEDGQVPAGWIELYNTSDTDEMDLRGVPLSDDLGKPDKWTIPCVPQAKVPPLGTLIVFTDGDTLDEDDFHASFTLPTAGLAQLILNKGTDIFFFDVSKLGADQAAGRFPDGGPAIAVLSEPTPGALNKEPAGSGTPAEASFVRADANEDARINITDMLAILKVLFQAGTPPSCRDRMDSNDDGAVNLTDVTYIGQALYQHGPTFPPPFPQAGKDPTADGLSCPAP
jgi:hypothetical protein